MKRGMSERRRERGVTLVIMALTLFLALSMSALAVDYGMIKAAKAEAQRATDAAALAGASAFLIPDPTVDKEPEAITRARDYAKKHTVHNVQVTDAEVGVNVDVPNQTVTVTYTGAGISLWFAQIMGFSSMGINAVSAAHVYETSNAACVMPVAVTDLWQNNDINGSNGVADELGTPDGIWSYLDRNHNGWMDPGTGNASSVERELWEYDPGIDRYDTNGDGQGDWGYGTTARNNLGGTDPFRHKVNDYGRQLMLMNLSPKDGTVSSNYYAWGFNSNDANSGDVLAQKISDP